LYWFRTPPGVRVGRSPLDEEAIRLIEEHHPDIRFDWPQILRGEEETEPAHPSLESAPETSEPLPTEPINPAHAQLGSEGLARLRARYADVMAAISRRIQDPQRADQLRAEAERLNPDSWVTSDEVRVALEQYESVFESFRGLVSGGRRRRRRRRSRGSSAGSTVQAGRGRSRHEEAIKNGIPDESSDAEPDTDDEEGSGEA
jgi:hypothetical protein